MSARLRTLFAAFLLLTLLLAPAAPATAGPAYPRDWNLYVRNQFGGPSSPIAVSADGAVFFSVGTRLHALQATPNPNDLEQSWLGDNLPGIIVGIVLQDNRAYVALSPAGLVIYDVTDPFHPVMLGRFVSPRSGPTYTITGLAVSGDYAYLADESCGVHVLNVADPATPSEVYLWDPEGVSHEVEAIALAGQTLYLADSKNGLITLSLQNPAQPTQLGVLAIEGTSRLTDIDVEGSYAYITQSLNMRVIDVSNPASPSLTTTYQDGCGALAGVDVSGRYAYVAGMACGVTVLDLVNFPTITALGRAPGRLSDIVYSNGVAYASVSQGGILTVDVSVPGTIEADDYDQSLSWVGDVTGLALDNQYLYINDVRNLVTYPTNSMYPSEGGRRIAKDVSYRIAAGSGQVYVANGNTISAYQHNPSGPDYLTLRGSDTTVADVNDMQVLGDRLYVAAANNGLRILNTTDAANMVEVGYRVTQGTARDVAVITRKLPLGTTTRLALIADGSSGLCIVNVTDEANPQPWRECVNTPVDARSVAVYSDSLRAPYPLIAYVADWSGGLCVINLTTSTETVDCSGFGGYPAQGVFRNGRNLYTVDFNGILHWYSLANLTEPVEVGRIKVPGGISGVAPDADGTVYVSTGDGGIAVITPGESVYLPVVVR